MVAAIPQAAAAATGSTEKASNPTRHPLLPSEKDQQRNNGSTHTATRKPRGKQVPSRYLSPSPSTSTTTTTTTTTTSSSSSSSSSFPKRFASPLLSRSTNSGPLHTPSTTTTSSFLSGSKRSQSADRRRPATSTRPTTPNPQGNATEMSAATKMLITSTRTLSVSFQGEAFSLPISKAKSVTPPQNNVARKATPERRRATPVRDQVENSKPMDQHRWPGRSREGNLKERNPLLSRSLDCSVVVGGGVDKRVIGSGFMGVKSLQQSMMIDDGRRLSLDLGNAKQNRDAISVNESSFTGDLTASDSDSVSSGSTSGMPEIGKKTGARGIAVSARFWQETNSRLRRLQDPGSPLSTSPGSRMGVSPKTTQSKRFGRDGPLSSPRMMAASPVRGAARPASPSKLWTSSASSPSRGMSSPSRVRPMSGSSPSILSFSVDLRRGKMGEDRIVDAHMLRLLYNRYLQWRFVNARADATFMVQRLNAEEWPEFHSLTIPRPMHYFGLPWILRVHARMESNSGAEKVGTSRVEVVFVDYTSVPLLDDYGGKGSLRRKDKEVATLNKVVYGDGWQTQTREVDKYSLFSVLVVLWELLEELVIFFIFTACEKFVECVGNDLRTTAFCHSQKNQVTFAEAKAEANFYTQGTTISSLFLILKMSNELVKHLEALMFASIIDACRALSRFTVIAHLEEWSLLDRDHSSSLEGATEALKASTLRLPVVGKALVDVQILKDAVGSAVDVMQAMASSICPLSAKVEDVNSLVAELANVTAKERHMLEQCKDFLSTLATVQRLQYSNLQEAGTLDASEEDEVRWYITKRKRRSATAHVVAVLPAHGKVKSPQPYRQHELPGLKSKLPSYHE
ncbi:unnamed protein product [Dovyalis caffra]|uniref:Uncharacterized protein n=1 Tax=Dovyalis caffra TaxID=77055 RepID=A0AAV1R7X1_9ROSI|nr:unnamed protein product [Dovyalis caffra]